MEIDISSEKDNPFLKRKELEINIKHDGSPTPSKSEIVKSIAERYSVPETHVMLNYVLTSKGTNITIGKIKIYQKPVVEAKPKEEKKEEKPQVKYKPEKKKEEKPKEAPKKEEKKPEAKEEPNKEDKKE